MTTPYGVPYREPCGGWVEPRREFFGGPFQHYKASETAIPLYANSFTYGETPSGPAETCEGGTIYHGNCYIDAETTQNFASCIKTGWKGVRARKAWHGRYPFVGCPEDSCDKRTTKYLTATMTITVQTGSWQWNGSSWDLVLDDSRSMTQTLTVNSGSGVAEQVACDTTEDATGQDDLLNRYRTLVGDCMDNEETGSMVEPPTYESGGPFKIVTVNAGGTSLELWQGDNNESGDYFRLHITVELTDAYTLDVCVADAVAMANEWDLADDVQYPWRTDGSRGVVPYVIRREDGPKRSDDFQRCGAIYCPIDPSVTGDSCVYDGEIVGDPLPNGYGPHYGYWSLWDSVTGLSIGWNPLGGLPSTATWWTTGDETDTDSFPDWGFVICRDGFVYVQKWAQVKDVMTSVNFFRPCGADRDKVDENDASYAAAYGGGVGYCDSVADPGTYPPILLYPDAWPICGRIAIVSKATVSGVTTVTLDEPASYLRVDDSVDLVSYGPSPDYDELIAETVTVASVAGDFLSFTY